VKPPITWHILTAEFPPKVGGVSDYSRAIAVGLAAEGDEVHVWCPPSGEEGERIPGVAVHRSTGSFSPRDLRALARELDAFPSPRRLLVQWVPHSYGYRSVNLPFCVWLLRRARSGDRVEIMVHEPWLPFRLREWRWNGPALVHRLMTVVLIRAATRVWVSAPEWGRLWRPYDPGGRTPFGWLPLSSGVPVARDPAGVQEVRTSVAPAGEVVLGYFGLVQGGVGAMLGEWVPAALRREDGTVALLIGSGSEECRTAIVERHPDLAERVRATGVLSREGVSLHLQACDVLLQPYPGGVNARRSSVVAALAHGLPVVTTSGAFTEPFWREDGGVALVPDDDLAGAVGAISSLVRGAAARRDLAAAAARAYDARFAARHALTALRGPDAGS
jgi:glycosyltransferase involved in cell wall biosynthesis